LHVCFLCEVGVLLHLKAGGSLVNLFVKYLSRVTFAMCSPIGSSSRLSVAYAVIY
jgi:hypothetical protein